MRILRYLLEHKSALALIVVLLLVQAMCDLALPGYTASIVDVGIGQSGIDIDALVDDLRLGREDLNDPAAQALRQIEAPDGSWDQVGARQKLQVAQEIRAACEARGVDMGARQVAYLVSIGIRMLLVTALGAVAAILVSFLASRTAATIAMNLRERLFDNVVNFSDAEVQRFGAASLITRATNDVQQVQMVCMVTMRMVLFAPLMALGGIVMVVRTDVKMSWIIVLAVLVVLSVIFVIMLVAMPKFKILQSLIDRMNLVAREILTGLPVIRAFNRQGYEETRFDDANANLMRTQLFTNRAMVFMMPTTQLVLNGVSALIVWVGASYIDAGTLQTGQMIAFITYSMVIITSFMMLSMVAIMLPRAVVAAERIDEVLECTSSIVDANNPRDGELDGCIGIGIEFDHVTFAYSDDSEPVLEDVSFSVAPGSTTAFIGATGSGKSTILKLIMRFYDVDGGCVRVNGIDVKELSQSALRGLFGYVPQTSFLFSGTIESNIAYSDADMALDRVLEAAHIAQATGFIEDKENAYGAEVFQGGSNVSGGQRQRLAIARALATRAHAFLFDDSFSALDYATDAALRRELGTSLKGSTVCIVAQRIATIRSADNIIVLDGGRIVGQGTHRHLLECCDVYREIAFSQLSEEELEGVAR